MARLLPILALLFNVWMLVDVHKRRAPSYWYYIIFLVPFGGVVYFFMYKAKDFKWGKWFVRPPSLSELEYRFKTTPSLANQVLFAKALYDAGHREDALWHFDDVLKKDADDMDAIYGKGRCLIDDKVFTEGIELLAKVRDRQPSFHDYEIWIDVAKAEWDAGKKEDCLATLQKLVRVRSRTDHQLALAQCLILLGRDAEAQNVVREALNEYDHAQAHTQRLYRFAAKTLRSLKR